ncbi:MAG: threonine/serine exporter family protein [Firmicutes bacterium]|nr:threonine/serine exporter family protein [Bacillota bacterium]
MKYDWDKLLQSILDVGEEMIVCGAEVSRVEDSIERMCESYGAPYERINVFIITSNIQVTLETPEGRILTQIRRLIRHGTNFDKLDYLNDLSRYICEHQPEPNEILKRLDDVMSRPEPRRLLKIFGAVIIAASFTVFFGGNWLDSIAAGFVGLVIVLMELYFASHEPNQVIYNFAVSFVAGLSALLLTKLGLGDNVDKIMIGGIMLLIPGIAMTNSIRDMLIGDIMSGWLRLLNAVLIAGAIACGFALSIILIGGGSI